MNQKIIKRMLLEVHKLGIKFRVHILPVHYYSPVPNIIDLQRTRNVWAKKSEMRGVTVNLEEQAATLKAICMPYQSEYAGNKIYQEGISKHFGPGYGYIEAQALHAFVRHYKPKLIIEVGSGGLLRVGISYKIHENPYNLWQKLLCKLLKILLATTFA